MPRTRILELLPAAGPRAPMPGAELISVESWTDLNRHMNDGDADVLLAYEGSDLSRVLETSLLPVVVASARPTVARAVGLMRRGAHDYVPLGRALVACEEAARSGDAPPGGLDDEHLASTRAAAVEHERLATLGRLAAGVSHEINNPAAFVLANLDELQKVCDDLHGLLDLVVPLALEHADEADRQKIRRTLDHAHWPGVFDDVGDLLGESVVGLRRIRGVVQDLRGLSRARAGERQAVDPNREVEQATSLLRHELLLNAKLDLDLSRVPTVLAAPGRIALLVLNLLTNALDSLVEGQAGAQVRVSTARERDHVRLIVEDNGTTLPAATLAPDAEPYGHTHQVDQSARVRLFVCRSIAEELQGELHAEQREGGGTRVVLRVPALVKEAEAFQVVTEAADPLTNARILVVDNEPAIVRSLKRLLRGARAVDTTTSGRDALERLLTDPPDAVVCDLLMPDVSGMHIHARLTDEHPELLSRIVFVTGGAWTEAARDFMAEHADMVLEKPFEPEELRRRLREALRTPR